jgi:hypothetical protein
LLHSTSLYMEKVRFEPSKAQGALYLPYRKGEDRAVYRLEKTCSPSKTEKS